jgi:hypothetical protein
LNSAAIVKITRSSLQVWCRVTGGDDASLLPGRCKSQQWFGILVASGSDCGLATIRTYPLILHLAKRTFSSQGLEVSMATITPEITVNRDGVFWHPLSTDEDMRVSKKVFPLSCAVKCVQEQIDIIAEGGTARITFT